MVNLKTEVISAYFLHFKAGNLYVEHAEDMVLILDGSSEICAHVWSEIGNLTC